MFQHGLLYVHITYRHCVNKRLSICYAVKRIIAQKFNPRCRANSAKRNYMRISNLLNRVVQVCSNWDPGKAGWTGCHVIKMLKKQTIYIRSGLAWLTGPTWPLRTNRVTKSMCCYATPIIENQQIGVLRTCISNFI